METLNKVNDKVEVTKSVTEIVEVKDLDSEITNLGLQKSGLESQIQGLQARVDGYTAEIAVKAKLRSDIVTKYPELEPKEVVKISDLPEIINP